MSINFWFTKDRSSFTSLEKIRKEYFYKFYKIYKILVFRFLWDLEGINRERVGGLRGFKGFKGFKGV